MSSADLPRESPRTILFQFVLFPLGIVAVAVGVFFLFGRLASDTRDVPDYLREVRSGGRRERWQAAYQLSQLINAGQAKAYPQLANDVMRLYRDSREDDPRIRQYLGLVLGKLGDRHATQVLVEGLADPAMETRIYAALALGELRDPAGVDPLVNAFRDDDRDLRKAAAYALGEIGDARAADALAAGLSDAAADVRFNAAIALARLGDARAAGVLREMLDRDRLARVEGMREEQKEQAILGAIPALVRVAPQEARAALEPLAAADPSMRVRSAAKQAMR